MKYENILFDLDGTLTDSGEGIMNSGRYALEKLGLRVPDERQLREMVGPPLSTAFPLLGVPDDKVDHAIRLYRDFYNNQGGKYQNSVYPGIIELLTQLRAREFRLYVATSKPEGLAREILSGFGLDGCFDYIAGATLDRSRENKGDVLRYLTEKVGRTEGTVLVGDTRYDVIGAQERGIPCIGVTWGYGTTEDLSAAGALTVVNTPVALLEYLTKTD